MKPVFNEYAFDSGREYYRGYDEVGRDLTTSGAMLGYLHSEGLESSIFDLSFGRNCWALMWDDLLKQHDETQLLNFWKVFDSNEAYLERHKTILGRDGQKNQLAETVFAWKDSDMVRITETVVGQSVLRAVERGDHLQIKRLAEAVKEGNLPVSQPSEDTRKQDLLYSFVELTLEHQKLPTKAEVRGNLRQGTDEVDSRCLKALGLSALPSRKI